MKKKIGIVITDGVGVCNFILSDFLKEVKKSFQEVTLYSGVPLSNYKEELEGINIENLNVFKESKIIYFFRKLKETAHLCKHKENFGMRHNFRNNAPKGYSQLAMLNRLVYFLKAHLLFLYLFLESSLYLFLACFPFQFLQFLKCLLNYVCNYVLFDYIY